MRTRPASSHIGTRIDYQSSVQLSAPGSVCESPLVLAPLEPAPVREKRVRTVWACSSTKERTVSAHEPRCPIRFQRWTTNHAFILRPTIVRQAVSIFRQLFHPAGTTMLHMCSVQGLAGMDDELVLPCCQARRRGQGLDAPIGHGARIGAGRWVSSATVSRKIGLRRLILQPDTP